jgi:bis(5'-nucleosyl)-tetraphosphatase (symmetrical)
MQLLEKISFDSKKDTLWFTGDLVNRGPQSLETLRFIKSLDKGALTVLGNHDLTLLAVNYKATNYHPRHHTFSDILQAKDKIELLDWLRCNPLIHHDPKLGFTLVHAGIYPQWDLKSALSLAKEVETVLQGPSIQEFFLQMYGNEPNTWDPNLSGFDRLRFIVNCFTRLRFCSSTGVLELTSKESADRAPVGYMPWFEIPNRATQNEKVLFGHWASLQGICAIPNVFPLDTGCVWGNCLTAMRLEDNLKFHELCT